MNASTRCPHPYEAMTNPFPIKDNRGTYIGMVGDCGWCPAKGVTRMFSADRSTFISFGLRDHGVQHVENDGLHMSKHGPKPTEDAA